MEPCGWPRAVVFDLDGTLVDTAGDLAAALNATLAELGLAPHPLEAVRPMIGGGLAELLDRALAAHDAALARAERDEAVSRLVAHYAESPAVLSRLYPGVADALRALKGKDVALGVCTNKPTAISRDILQALGVAEHFACIQGGDLGIPKKPDPQGLAKAIQTLGAQPGSAVMVGDSATDVETARGAGIGVLLVSHGYSDTPVAELGADAVINHFHELVPALALLG